MNQELAYRIPRTIKFKHLTREEVSLIKTQLPTLANHTVSECLTYYIELVARINNTGSEMLMTVKRLEFLKAYNGENKGEKINSLVKVYGQQVRYLNQIMQSADKTLQLLMRNFNETVRDSWMTFSKLMLHWLDLKRDMHIRIIVPYLKTHHYTLPNK